MDSAMLDGPSVLQVTSYQFIVAVLPAHINSMGVSLLRVPASFWGEAQRKPPFWGSPKTETDMSVRAVADD